MNIKKVPSILYKESIVVLYNFSISRYPAQVKSLAEADCISGHQLVDKYKQKPSQELYEAITYIHNFLGATYFGRSRAADAIGLSKEDFRAFDQQRKRQNQDASSLALVIQYDGVNKPDDSFESDDESQEAMQDLNVNASAAIAEGIDAHRAVVRKALRQNALKGTQQSALKRNKQTPKQSTNKGRKNK